MKITLYLLITVLVTTTRLIHAQSGRSTTPSKPTTEQRTIGSFDQLTVRNAIGVLIIPGNANQIELESEADQLQRVITRMNGTELIIEVPEGKLLYTTRTNARGKTTSNSKPISVTLHVSALKAIHLETACDLTIDSPITTEALTVVLNSACHLTTALSVRSLNLTLDAASGATLKGSVAGQADVRIREASQLAASELTVKQVTINLTGSSEATIKVSETLRATADGNSELRYSGNPTVKSVKATGQSSIERN